MDVPFVDLRTQYRSLRSEILPALEEILDRAEYVAGKRVRKFEVEFASAHRARYALGLSSGTDALHLALWALGVGPGDEVIVPVNTYIATSECVSLLGGKPVFVDHVEDTFAIDPKGIEEVINSRTKGIIAVHLYGQTADLAQIFEIAKRRGLFLIEDCSQAHLATHQGTPVGTFGEIGTFSFYPSKNLGSYGEAGAVITNDENLYEKMRCFRQHGEITKYEHEMEGHNYRMEELQGAVLAIKLKYLPAWTDLRRRAAEWYRESLEGLHHLRLPAECPGNQHVYHLFVVRVEKRDQLRQYLKEQGVGTGIHYPKPLHLQRAYSYLGHRPGDFKVAEECCQSILSLPMFPEITRAQVQYVADQIRKFYGEKTP